MDYNFFVELEDIIRKRTTPGILILDRGNCLLYSNEEAFSMFPCLRENRLPDAIVQLCRQAGNGKAVSRMVQNDDGTLFSARALQVEWDRSVEKTSHVLVLMEGVIRKRQIDLERAQSDFDLTKREIEVLELICHGLSNRQISEELAIGEYTVKDHMKHIMRKMKVTSRSRIISCLQ